MNIIYPLLIFVLIGLCIVILIMGIFAIFTKKRKNEITNHNNSNISVKQEYKAISDNLASVFETSKNDDVVCSFLPTKEDKVKNEGALISYDENKPKSANKQLDVSQNDNCKIIGNLEIQFLQDKEYCMQFQDSIEISNEKPDKEICKMTGVPYWEHTYVYSVNELRTANHLQRQFYSYFKKEFLQQHYLDIDGNSNYAFVLMFDLADGYKKHKDYTLLKQQLNILAEKYPETAQYIDRTILNVITIVNQETAEKTLKSYDKSRGQLCKWISPNEVIEIQGIKLTRGNFYVGECFRLPDNIIRDNDIHIFGYNNDSVKFEVVHPRLSR